MIILLLPIFMGLMTTGIIQCNQQENPKKRTGDVLEAPQYKRRDIEGRRNSEEDKKQAAAAVLQLTKRRDVARAFERRSSATTDNSLVTHLPPQEEQPVDMSVVNLRGQMEAQDIDTQRRSSWCDQLMAMCAGSRRQADPLAPPKLERQYSYYPGRLSPEPLSPEPGSEPTNP